MAFRSAGTLMTEFNAAFVPPALMPGYKGHVPGVASSFGSPYGTITFKYFQDLRNTALEKGCALLSGGRFPTIFSPNPTMVLASHIKNWDRWLHLPIYSPLNLDMGRNAEVTDFYQVGLLISRHSADNGPILTPRPPLSPKDKWNLLRVSSDYVKPCQTFPSGKRVSSQERQRRDRYFEFRA
ncbi:putative UPF0573 protein C2orf70 like protein [Cricetulus griseus]|nr:putative UPF0573 protein C2orf70 like protein [Cricetulus griseus]